MEVFSKINHDIFQVSLKGELDANGAINLDNIIRKAIENHHYKILIDCQNLNYISSAGLGVFISYHEDLSQKNGGFVFFNLQENVFNVFKILGLEKVMTIAEDFSEAKRVLNEN